MKNPDNVFNKSLASVIVAADGDLEIAQMHQKKRMLRLKNIHITKYSRGDNAAITNSPAGALFAAGIIASHIDLINFSIPALSPISLARNSSSVANMAPELTIADNHAHRSVDRKIFHLVAKSFS
jgi:hypothetical protein